MDERKSSRRPVESYFCLVVLIESPNFKGIQPRCLTKVGKFGFGWPGLRVGRRRVGHCWMLQDP